MDSASTVIGAGLDKLKTKLAAWCIVYLCCSSSLAVIKVPRICHPCDNQGTFDKLFFKCINDAGEKSDSCKDFTNMSKAIAILQKEAKDVTEAVVKSVTSALGYIPNKVKESALHLLQDLKKTPEKIMEILNRSTVEFIKAVGRAVFYIKNFKKDAFKWFFTKYIQPLLDKYLQQIINPLVSILNDAIKLRDDIIAAVLTGMRSIPGLVWDDTGLKDVYAAVTEIVTLIPEHIRHAMDKINGIVSEVKGIGSKITMPFNKLSDGLDEFRNLRINIPDIPGFKIPVINKSLPNIPMPDLGKPFKKLPTFPQMTLPDVSFDIFADLTRVHDLKDQILEALNVDNVNEIKDLVSEGLTNLFNTVLGNLQLLIYSFISLIESIVKDIYEFIYKYVYTNLLTVFMEFKDKTIKDIKQHIHDFRTKVLAPIMQMMELTIMNQLKKHIGMFMTEVKTLVIGLFQDIGNFFKNSSQVIRKAVKVMGRNVFSIMIHSFGMMLDAIMPMNWTRQMKFQVAFGGCFLLIFMKLGGSTLMNIMSFFIENFMVPFIPGF